MFFLGTTVQIFYTKRMKSKKTIILLCTLAIMAVLLFFSIWKYAHHIYNALDLAIYSQTAWHLTHGHSLYNSIQGSSYFGDHVEFMLFPISLVFYFFSHPITLTTIQICVILSGVIPVYMITKRLTSEYVASAASIVFLLHPLVWNNALFEFHILTFAIPLLLWVMYAYATRSFKLFVLFGLLALAVREDVALAVFGVGLLALADRRSLRWWLAPMLGSVVWFVTAFFINAHAADHGYKFFAFYSWLGSSIPGILQNIFYHPLIVLSHLCSVSNILFPIGLLLLFVGLPLKGLRGLLPAALVFLQLFFGLFNVKTLLSTHYTSLLIPFLVYASVLGIQRIRSEMENRLVKIRPEYKTLSLIIVVVILVVNIVAIGPILGLTTQTRPNTHIAAEIPKTASVVASYGPITDVAARENVYSLHYFALGHKQFSNDPYVFPTQPDYVLLDLEDFTTFEFQYASNEYYKDEYQSMPMRLREFLDWYTITKRTGNEMLLAKKTTGDSLLTAGETLATLTKQETDETKNTFVVKKIDENTDTQLGSYLTLQTSLHLSSSDEWRHLAFRITYENQDGVQTIEAPVAWHLFAFDDPSYQYNVKMFIATDGFASRGSRYTVEMLTRSGQLQIAPHRGTKTVPTEATVLASSSVAPD